MRTPRPLYFFDVDDGDRTIRDDTGTEFPDVEAARTAGMEILPEVACDRLRDNERFIFTSNVRDEDGEVVFRAVMSLVIERLNETLVAH